MAGCADDSSTGETPQVSPPAATSSTPSRQPDPVPLVIEAPESPPAGMVWVPGGKFEMGTDYFPLPGVANPDRIKQDEYPQHRVELDGFWMSASPVTNREFAEFVTMTGHVTLAERAPTTDELRRMGLANVPVTPDLLRPNSICFKQNIDADSLVFGEQNWEYQLWEVRPGATWRQPEGPGSSIDDRMDHPVVHVNYEDARAYCEWIGAALPTEAQFEYAARGGGRDVKYPWGNGLTAGDKELCNYFQGEFPLRHLNRDGYLTTSPVRSFPPNSLGLYDMAGNVWEWCRDLYDDRYYESSPRRNPTGPARSHDATAPPIERKVAKRVQRGGSFLCNVNNCTGYRCGARMRCDELSSSFHCGFRYVVEVADREAFESHQVEIAAWRSTRDTSDESAPH
jgi:sulfatase modifying factor 1